MFKSVLNNNRGVALIITLSIISILIAGALELNKKARVTIVSAAAARDRITLSQMALSGIHTGMAVLIKDKYISEIDSLQEAWASTEIIDTLLNHMFSGNGSVTLKISDERSRIQVNALVGFPEGLSFNISQKLLWERFLKHMMSLNDQIEIDPVTIINAVKDWIDSGDDDAITGLSGAESGYYEDLEPSYPCKNGYIRHIDELLMIKGITQKLFNGSKITGGISEYMTPYGIDIAKKKDSQEKGNNDNRFTFTGKININTADILILSALLPEEHKILAQNINEYRMEVSGSTHLHDLSKPTWYQNVPGCGDIKIDPDLITTSSDIFRITATARTKDMEKTIIAVVRREKEKKTGKWKCCMLSLQHE